jgi:hypothetical protein
MSEENVKVNIGSSSDPAAIDATIKRLETLEEKGKGAGKGAMDAGKGLGILGQTAGAASGSLTGMMSLLAGLAQKFPALGAQITVLLGAFTAWKAAVDAVNKTLAENAEESRKGAEAQTAAEVDKITKAYEDMVSALDDVNAAMGRTREIEAARRQANRADQDAALELEKQKALSAVAPGDDIGRRRVEAEFDARRSSLDSARGGEDSSSKADALRRQAEQERIRARMADEQATALIPKRGEVIRQASEKSAVQQREAGAWWRNSGQSDDVYKKYQPGIDKLVEKMDSLTDAIKSQRETAAKARSAADELDQLAEIAGRGAGTARTKGAAAQVAASRAVSEIDHDAADRAAKARARSEAAAEADRIRAQLGGVEVSVAAAKQRAAFEGADVDRAQAAYDKAEDTPGKSGRAARNRELEALRKALAREQQEARDAIAAAARIIEDAAKATKDLQQRLRQAESRAKTSSSDSGQGD